MSEEGKMESPSPFYDGDLGTLAAASIFSTLQR
jgi:hypothetical protein